MLLFAQILLALGIDELVKYLTPFVFLLVWIISQILEAKNKSTPKATPPAPPAPPQPKRPEVKPMAEAAATQSDPLRKQVDEFLRRAGNPAPEPKGRPDRPTASDIEILIDDQASALRRERLAEPLRPIERTAPKKAQPPARQARSSRPADEVRRGPSVERVGESVNDSVQAIEAATARLGQRIVEEDAQFDIELQSRFDHQVGTLGGRSETPTTESSVPEADSPAAQIAAMLARPQGAQQAVVLNEILRRPVDRW